MGQFNYIVKYNPGKQNTAADALSRHPDYVKKTSKRVYFADEMGLPLCIAREFTKSTECDFRKVIPGTLAMVLGIGSIYDCSEC